MYLIDTNVISGARKKAKANLGVSGFFERIAAADEPICLSVVSVGEFCRDVELIRHRGDAAQARLLDDWLAVVLEQFAANILPLDEDAAQVWGRLHVPDPAHELDQRIAAIALVNDLTAVTHTTADFEKTGVRAMNPFCIFRGPDEDNIQGKPVSVRIFRKDLEGVKR